jgi:hypothetical protein
VPSTAITAQTSSEREAIHEFAARYTRHLRLDNDDDSDSNSNNDDDDDKAAATKTQTATTATVATTMRTERSSSRMLT